MPRRLGFTLIELLVVISIIALLIGLLLPVLGKARKAAMIVKCTSNVGQIAKAWQSYLQDYDETFPHTVGRGISYQRSYGGYADGDGLDLLREERPLNPYLGLPHPATLKDVSVFRCTEERPIRALREGWKPFGDLDTKSVFEVYGNSYMLNPSFTVFRIFSRAAYDATPDIRQNHSKLVPTRLAIVQLNPATVVLIADEQAYYSARGLQNWDAFWHNDDHYSNVGFLDGHAKFTQIEEGVSRTSQYTFGIRKKGWTTVREDYVSSLQAN